MTRHKALINELIAKTPGTRAHLFRKNAIDAIKRTQGHMWSRSVEQDMREDLNFIPDAYQIDKDGRELIIYEVETTHPIDPSKRNKLSWAWISLDCIEWNLRLITVNGYGARAEVDLCSAYHELIDELYFPKPPVVVEEKPEEPPGKRPRGPRSNKVFWWETPLVS